MTAIAFHGKQSLKDEVLQTVLASEAAGNFKQHWHGDGSNVGVKMGTVGSHDDALYESQLGVPVGLVRLQGTIFKNLPPELAATFPRRFLEAIQPGADLSDVLRQFTIWHLTDTRHGVIQLAREDDSRAAILAVADAYARRETDPAEWFDLRNAAWDARTHELSRKKSPRGRWAAEAAMQAAMSSAIACGHMNLRESTRLFLSGAAAASSAEATINAHAAPLEEYARPPWPDYAEPLSAFAELTRRLQKLVPLKTRTTPDAHSTKEKENRASAGDAMNAGRIAAFKKYVQEATKLHLAQEAAEIPLKQATAEVQAQKLLELLAAAKA